MTSKKLSDPVYAEINLATREIQAEGIDRYANFKSPTGETSPRKQDTNVITFPATKDGSSRKCVLVLSLILALVVIGVACGGAYLAFELSQLKATIPLLLNNSAPADELQDSTMMLNHSFIDQLYGDLEVLDEQLHQFRQDLVTMDQQLRQELDVVYHELNAANNKTEQLNTSIMSTLLEIVTITNHSNLDARSMIQVINTSIFTFIQEANNSHNQLGNEISNSSTILLELYQILNQNITSFLSYGKTDRYPASSCAALPPSSPSGYYWVRASDGSAVRVYCDMTRSCGGVTGGWMRVAQLDMTNSSHQCPSGLRQRSDFTTRGCVKNSNAGGCSSVIFQASGISYFRVCGRVIAYQYGTTNAFLHRPNTIDSSYVDGVSLTHGRTSKHHIWTFASALDETVSVGLSSKCPCHLPGGSTGGPPDFVGSDYFCDTGSIGTVMERMLYLNNPLWDGDGCGGQSTCCEFNNPPWFYKQLPLPTTDDIEMRVCRNQEGSDEDVAVEMIEIYVW